jgi:hypothetical protein
MKKKGPRSIPSFAPQKNKPGAKPDPINPLDPNTQPPPPPPRPPAIKPQATSQKSGRRGS